MPDGDLNFMSLFVSMRGERVAKTKSGEKAFVRTKVTRALSTSTTPAPTTPTEAPKLAALAEKTVSAPAPAATAAGWTEVEEQTLWDMKQQSKSWKEIEEAIPGKERGVMKERYRTLSEAKQKEKGEGEKKVEEKKDKEEERKAGDGRNNAKEGEKGGKGEDDKSEGGKKSSMKERKEKKDDAVGAGGEIKKVGDRPVIYLDEGDQLDAGQLAELYRLHAKAERGKWVEISSRFFDKTGKRIDPSVLKDKLGNC